MPTPKIEAEGSALRMRPHAREFVALAEQLSVMTEQLSRLVEMQGAVHTSVTEGFARMDRVGVEAASVQCGTVKLGSPFVPSPSKKCDFFDKQIASSDAYGERPKLGQSRSCPSLDAMEKPKLHSRSTSSLMSAFANSKLSKANLSALNVSESDHYEVLMEVFDVDRKQQEEKAAREARKKNRCTYLQEVVVAMDRGEWDLALASFMGVVICINSIFIGFSMDMNYGGLGESWFAMELFFTAAFAGELVVKIWIHGFSNEFFGPASYWNWYDAVLVFFDVLQLALSIANASASGLPSTTLLRLVRLARLARMARLLRNPIFTDLLCMLHGMFGGMRTLAWAMLFFLIVVYTISLLAREILGTEDVADVSNMFDTVPRAMLTTFRCSFGDCTTAKGTPVFEHVNDSYGGSITLMYCVVTFMITVGLFNVHKKTCSSKKQPSTERSPMERTMAAASELNSARRVESLNDDVLWCTCMATLVRRLMDLSPEHDVPERLADAMSEIVALDVPASLVDDLAEDPEAAAALEKLDIDRLDHLYLSSILDPDNGGTIRVFELMDGIKRLRGATRRSDVITIDLMVRSVQRDLAAIKKAVGCADETVKRMTPPRRSRSGSQGGRHSWSSQGRGSGCHLPSRTDSIF